MPPPHFTRRETQILEAILAGRSYKEISRELGLSINSLGVHCHHIYRKIGVRCRSGAILWHFRGRPDVNIHLS